MIEFYMEEIKQPRLKLISKSDFELVKGKYGIVNDAVNPIIAGALPTDILALKVIPGSGLKILGAKILNEDSEEFFTQLMIQGVESI